MTGVRAPLISQLKRKERHSGGAVRTMGDDTARKLEKGMRKPFGWMDHDHTSARTDLEADFVSVFRSLTPEQQDSVHQMARVLARANKPPDIDPGDPHRVGPTH